MLPVEEGEVAGLGTHFEGRGDRLCAEGLDVSCSREGGIKDDSNTFSLRIWKKALPFTKMGWMGKNRSGGKMSSVLDMFQGPVEIQLEMS